MFKAGDEASCSQAKQNNNEIRARNVKLFSMLNVSSAMKEALAQS